MPITDPQSAELRAKWCEMLARLVQPDRPEDARSALLAYLPMLEDVSDLEFRSRTALETVARWKRRTVLPSLYDVRDAFAEWRNTINPRQALPDDSRAGWSALDHAWERYFYAREQEGYAAVNGAPASSRRHVLSLVRAQSPLAYARITGEVPERREAPTVADVARVRDVVSGLREEAA